MREEREDPSGNPISRNVISENVIYWGGCPNEEAHVRSVYTVVKCDTATDSEGPSMMAFQSANISA